MLKTGVGMGRACMRVPGAMDLGGVGEMAYRTVERVTEGDVTINVQWDAEWQDFRARIAHPARLRNPDADYHTDDRADAVATARSMARRLWEPRKPV